MASLPADLKISARLLTRTERSDDIARLKSELQLPALKYVDVSVQRALRRTLQRWPLLAELEQAQHTPGERVSLARHGEQQVSV